MKKEIGQFMEQEHQQRETLLTLTAEIVAAHAGNNTVALSDLPKLIVNVHTALSELGRPELVEDPAPVPAVSIRASVKHDYIVCLEDGMKLKMLKRHLATTYNMTPEQYRARWNLPADYPMVAPAYAEKRRELAKAIGLGRKSSKKQPSGIRAKPAVPRGRKPVATA